MERSLCYGRWGWRIAPPIFKEIPEERVIDFEWIQCQADHELRELAGKKVRLYTSGLTQALISVWNAARMYSIELEVMHYNIDTEEWVVV